MKKYFGFSSFEFYFVLSVIGLILIVGIQRYIKLAGETQRLSFEVLAQNFSAAVYNHRARWILAQQSVSKNQLVVDKLFIQFSPEGWPVAIAQEPLTTSKETLIGCLSLWNNFLQNPPLISFSGGDIYGSRSYHLRLTTDGKCHFEAATSPTKGFYFEYSPISGQITTYTRAIAKNS